jgi:hypothetical protein
MAQRLLYPSRQVRLHIAKTRTGSFSTNTEFGNKMNNWNFKAFAATAALAFSTAGWALPADIGSLDTLAPGSPNPTRLANSGDATEIAWMEAVLGMDFDDSTFVKWNVGDGAVTVTEEGGRYFFSFGDYRPTHFYIKYGAGGPPASTHYLYVNNSSTAWGYVDSSPGGFSHVGFFGTRTKVPEPTTLALLGLGLAGLGLARRRRTK